MDLNPVAGHGAVYFPDGWRKCLCRCDSCLVCTCTTFFASYTFLMTASVVLWSEFLTTDPEAWVRFPALTN
jgi:hypothetical protein